MDGRDLTQVKTGDGFGVTRATVAIVSFAFVLGRVVALGHVAEVLRRA